MNYLLFMNNLPIKSEEPWPKFTQHNDRKQFCCLCHHDWHLTSDPKKKSVHLLVTTYLPFKCYELWLKHSPDSDQKWSFYQWTDQLTDRPISAKLCVPSSSMGGIKRLWTVKGCKGWMDLNLFHAHDGANKWGDLFDGGLKK